MKKIIIAALLLTSVNIFADTENQFVFLFDNSGSMLPFYIQPQSTFKTFCKALIKNSVKKDDKADVMLFTKTDPGRGIVSPKVLFSGESSGMIMDDLMSKFTLTTGKDNLTGTTDLIEALDKGISAIKGSTGIIWLITDNINDNTGTGDSLNAISYL